jgi:hypothetical protein
MHQMPKMQQVSYPAWLLRLGRHLMLGRKRQLAVVVLEEVPQGLGRCNLKQAKNHQGDVLTLHPSGPVF